MPSSTRARTPDEELLSIPVSAVEVQEAQLGQVAAVRDSPKPPMLRPWRPPPVGPNGSQLAQRATPGDIEGGHAGHLRQDGGEHLAQAGVVGEAGSGRRHKRALEHISDPVIAAVQLPFLAWSPVEAGGHRQQITHRIRRFHGSTSGRGNAAAGCRRPGRGWRDSILAERRRSGPR